MKGIIKKSKGMPRRRLQHIYDLARTRTVCEGGGNQDKDFDPLSVDSEEMVKKTVSAPLSSLPPPLLFLPSILPSTFPSFSRFLPQSRVIFFVSC